MFRALLIAAVASILVSASPARAAWNCRRPVVVYYDPCIVPVVTPTYYTPAPIYTVPQSSYVRVSYDTLGCTRPVYYYIAETCYDYNVYRSYRWTRGYR